jgi:hypothetical protein
MPKVVIPPSKYYVSFNMRMNNDFEVGDSSMNTVDFIGDDIDALSAEVIADDPNYPMVFERSNVHRLVVGVFYGVDEGDDDRYPTALMCVCE